MSRCRKSGPLFFDRIDGTWCLLDWELVDLQSFYCSTIPPGVFDSIPGCFYCCRELPPGSLTAVPNSQISACIDVPNTVDVSRFARFHCDQVDTVNIEGSVDSLKLELTLS